MKNKPSKLGDILKNITKSYIAKEAAKERTKSYDIRRIFEQMELDLISSMKRAFYFHKREEQKEGFSWEQWQLSKLRAIEKYRKQNKKIVESYSEPIQEAIDRELTGNYKKGQGKIKNALNKIKSFLNLNKVKVDVPDDTSESQRIRDYVATLTGREAKVQQEDSFFGLNEKKLNALQEVVSKDLKKAQYSVLRKMDDVYRQTIFKTQVYLQSGTKTINQAIDMATKDFLDKGINSITYKDGKRVNISSYAEMCLRTANQRATFLGEGSKRDEYGIHLVVVSAHANTCEKCEAWQGKVLIDDVFSHPSKEYIKENINKYKLLSEAIQSGLLHPNCRHTLATYFPGISKLPIVPDGKAAVELYEAEQKQRALERQIRKWKRIEAGTCDAKSINDASRRIKELETQLKSHLDTNNQLRRSPQREINRIPIDKVNSSDKIINREWLKANFSTQKKFDRHIEKHLSEYGDITPEDYLNTARDLLAAPLSNDIEGFISKDGFTFKYRISTNDFTIGRADGKVSTLFKPKENIEYWKEQMSLFKDKGE